MNQYDGLVSKYLSHWEYFSHWDPRFLEMLNDGFPIVILSGFYEIVSIHNLCNNIPLHSSANPNDMDWAVPLFPQLWLGSNGGGMTQATWRVM